MTTRRIIFVCSGNICRSPMAAGLAKQMFAERDEPAMIISAGTLNIQGRPAAEFGITAMREIDIDITDHYSQGVAPQLVAVADHIVVMAPGHEDYLLEFNAAFAPRIVRLWEYADEPLAQIDDPVGGDLHAFRTCRDLIHGCLQRWIDELEPLD